MAKAIGKTARGKRRVDDAHLIAQLERAEREGLPAVDGALRAVSEAPEVRARAAAIDIARALARSLRVGLLDEFGWSALEDAADELGGPVTLHGGLPAVIAATQERAIAVGPRGRLGVHELAIPRRHRLVSLRFIGGQFLVLLASGTKTRAYWSGAPGELFEVEARRAPALASRACVLADGAWLEGKTPVRLGDRAWPDASLTSCDGVTAWVTARKGGRELHREVAANGELDGYSWAAVLGEGLQPEWFVDGGASYVLPAPDGLDASPLGANDGMLGLRVSYRGEPDAREVMRIDGRTWTGPMAVRPHELLALPGGELRPVVVHTARRAGATILDETGKIAGSRICAAEGLYWCGSVAAYPVGLWHALAPRDVEGSSWLRAAGDADARGLVEAAAGKPLAQVGDIVARSIRDITHPRLRAGVAGLVALAAQLQTKCDRLRESRPRGRRRPLS